MTTFNRKLAFAAAIFVAGFAGAAQAQNNSIAYSTAHNELETNWGRGYSSGPYGAHAMYVDEYAVSPSRMYWTDRGEYRTRGYYMNHRHGGMIHRQDRAILDAEIRDNAWRN